MISGESKNPRRVLVDPSEPFSSSSSAPAETTLPAELSVPAHRTRRRDPEETTPGHPGLSLLRFVGLTPAVRANIRVRQASEVRLEGVPKRVLVFVFGVGFALALTVGVLVGAALS